MKIKEVETLAGITKKNIRFYEEQGLLSPKRNVENGYREYTDEDVQILRQIKLLRKLGISIEDTRQILNGSHTVGDGMRRHLVTLERERRNLEQSIALCQELQMLDIPVTALDTHSLLSRMEEMEHSGASFQNKQVQDIRTRYIAPVLVTLIVIVLLTALVALLVWAYASDPTNAPPLGLLLISIGVCLAVGGGVILALLQRIHEIGKGEIDDARHY